MKMETPYINIRSLTLLSILLVPVGASAAPSALNENRSWVTKSSVEFEEASADDYVALNDLMHRFLADAKLGKCEVAYVYPVGAGPTLFLVSTVPETADYLSSIGKVFDSMNEELRHRHSLARSDLGQTKLPTKDHLSKPQLKQLRAGAWLLTSNAQLARLDIGDYRVLNDSMFSLILEVDFDHPLEGCIVPTSAGPTLVLLGSAGTVVSVPKKESLDKLCELIAERVRRWRNVSVN